MHGSDWLERRMRARRNGRCIGAIISAALGFFLFGAIAITGVLAELGAVHASGYPPGAKTLVVAVVALAICAVCVMTAVRSEHRLRGLPAGRLADEMSNASQTVAARLGTGAYRPYRRLRGYRRHGPVTMLTAGIWCFLVAVAAVLGAFGAHAGAGRSSATQHGISDTATVGGVTINRHTSRGTGSANPGYTTPGYRGTGYTTQDATIDATLRTPVGGQRATVVHVPHSVSYLPGQVISVRVDPADPGYSELPGQPYDASGEVIGLVVAAVLAVVLGTGLTIASARTRRRWRAVLDSDSSPGNQAVLARNGSPAGAPWPGSGPAAAAVRAISRLVNGPGPATSEPGGGYKPGSGSAAAAVRANSRYVHRPGNDQYQAGPEASARNRPQSP